MQIISCEYITDIGGTENAHADNNKSARYSEHDYICEMYNIDKLDIAKDMFL